MQDPQDRGPGYRNVVGIPGGMDSELYKVFASKNKNNMKLLPGSGAEIRNGRATEDDAINTVYVVDSSTLPFHKAEMCAPAPASAMTPRFCRGPFGFVWPESGASALLHHQHCMASAAHLD